MEHGVYFKTPEGKTTKEKIHEIVTASFALKDYGNADFIKSVLYDLLDRIEILESQSFKGSAKIE